MANKIKTLIFLFLAVVLALSAYANFDVSVPILGSSSQERGQNVSASLVVINREHGKNITSVEAVFSGDSKYKVSAPFETGLDLAENESDSFLIKAYVPLDLDAVDSKGKKIAVEIGSLQVKANYSDGTSETKTFQLSMEAENLLRFGDPRITIGDKNDKGLDDKDSFKDVRREDKVTIDIEIKNKFDDRGDCNDPDDYGDCQIENIEARFEPDDSDFDDETIDFNDLSSDSKDTESFSFYIPDDADEKDYDFELWVTGKDENGARHGEYMKFTLEVEVPRDEITITKAYFSPESIECDQHHSLLRVTIKNTGRDDQDKASIFVDSSKLDIRDSIYNIELDSGDSVSKSFDLTWDKDLEPGTYYVTVKANYDKDEETDIESVPITINECKQPNPETSKNETVEESENTKVNIIEVPPSSGVIYGKEKEKSFFESDEYLLLLGGLFLVFLFVFFVLIIAILKK